MVETRIATRHRVKKPAIIEHGWHGRDQHPCTVRDISSTGAALEFADPVVLHQLPEKITLVIPEDELRVSCRVVWQRNYRLGVAFDVAISLGSP